MKLDLKYWIAAGILLFVMLPAAPALATQQTFKAASLAQPMNNRMGSARSAVLGPGFTGIADDPAALLWNPAGLAQLKRGQVGLHHCSWIGEVLQETALFALPIKKIGSLGMMVNFVNYGTFQGRDANGVPTRTLGASDLGYGVGWGRKLTGRLSAGFVFRGQQQTLADSAYSTLSADLGVLVHLPYDLRLGFSYNNFGTQLGGSHSATAVRTGLAWETPLREHMHVLIGVGYSAEPDATDRISLAAEFRVNSLVVARGGYELKLGDDLIDDFTGATVGLGLNLSQVRLDYSFLPFGELGAAHRVSLVYMFPQRRIEPADEPKPTRKPTPRPPVVPAPRPKRTPSMMFQLPQSALDQAKNLEAEGRFQEAIQAYNQAIHLNPKGVTAWRGLAALYYKLGRKEFAIHCFEEALKLNPADQQLRDWLKDYKVKP